MLARLFFLALVICKISAIHYGAMAAIKEFPYMVDILKNEYHICGGSLINKWLVITAAHCVKWQQQLTHNYSNYLLQAGTTLIGNNYGSNYQRREVYDFFIHFDFGVVENHDVGIMKVKEPFQLNDYVNIVNLPRYDQEDYFMGETVYGAGWGHDANDKYPPALKKMKAKIQNYRYCRKRYDKEILCARGQENSVMCWGDSGGPLTIHDSERPKLVGVFTNMMHFIQNNSCITNTDITIVNVAYVMPWVIEVMGEHGKS